MLVRIKNLIADYPRQFWMLFLGMLISATGGGMVWPFLTIYIRQKLEIPLTTVTLLVTLNAGMAILSMFLAGPIADHFGRKWLMFFSMLVSCFTFLAMSQANTLILWAILILFNGVFNPLFRVGSDAMVADLVSEDKRSEAYALLLTSNNVGIAIGPAIGGFIAAASYTIAFLSAAGLNFLFACLIFFTMVETLPMRVLTTQHISTRGSLRYIVHDKPFLSFIPIYAIGIIPASIMMVLLPVYAKENFGIIESQYGFILAANALMVVLFQYIVTLYIKRFPIYHMLALGTLFYGIGAGSVALGHTFIAFLISMVILTIGELILAPTGTTLTANLAPVDMRGRYMGIFGLTLGISSAIGPVMGGILNDRVAPVAIWYGALFAGLLATVGFIILSVIRNEPTTMPGKIDGLHPITNDEQDVTR